jgi:hypothetical protein
MLLANTSKLTIVKAEFRITATRIPGRILVFQRHNSDTHVSFVNCLDIMSTEGGLISDCMYRYLYYFEKRCCVH